MSTNHHPASAETGTEHLRYELTQLEKMRDQILHDMEALRTQETNLRALENRLRTAPDQSAGAPPSGALNAEWEKFQRSRALLEAERRSLTDERIAVREEAEALKRREEALRQREAWVEVRERDLAVKAMPPPKGKKRPTLAQASLLSAKHLLSFGRAH